MGDTEKNSEKQLLKLYETDSGKAQRKDTNPTVDALNKQCPI